MRCGKRPSKRAGETSDCDLTEPRQFNLMFGTRVGAVEETGVDVYLRPETAQGIFVNFKNVAQLARRKPPFGIAQVGKAFRNEITPGNFIFRTLEFEQMEMEFFVPPAEADEWYRYWVAERLAWHVRYGLREENLRVRPHDADELSHYSSGTSDIEYLFPIGWSELEGIANRGDFDLTQHTEASGTKLEWVDSGSGERFVPHVIEPALGVNRSMLAFVVDAYDEEVVAERERTVLRLHPQLAPVKAAVLPLIGKDTAMVEKARALYEELRLHVSAEYDDSGAIGRRYRRQDEIGTPWAFTIDEQTLEDGSITLRDRDSLAQERIPLEAAREQLLARLHTPWSPPPRAAVNRPGLYTRSRYTWRPRRPSRLRWPRSATSSRTTASSHRRSSSSVAIDMAARNELWEPLVRVDPDRRRYELVYEDERMDAWVLSWMPGQATGYHDHYISGVGICVAAGSVREDLLVYGGEDVALRLRTRVTRDEAGPATSTACGTRTVSPAVTIHVYSPRLDWVGQYRLGDDGVVRREIRPGRNELTEQLIAEGALHRVLERF